MMYSVARLIKELPENYETECAKQGAVRRWRGVKSPADLMMLILIHLMNGTSLLETSIIAKTAKLGNMSDVAFMNRLAQCKNWFVSICQSLLSRGQEHYEKPAWLSGKALVAVDASDVVEKGRTGRTYRLHYMLDIFNMSGLQCNITEQSVGAPKSRRGLHLRFSGDSGQQSGRSHTEKETGAFPRMAERETHGCASNRKRDREVFFP